MKRVLVTGANGFVCSNIVLALLQHDYQVIAADRDFDPLRTVEWQQRGVQLVTSDMTQFPDFDADYVIHGAAITADPVEDETPESHFRANVNPALAMLDWARDHAVQRLIFISSSAVFRGSGVTILSEDTPVATDGLLYAVEKHSIELLINALKGSYQRDVISVRLGNIYGTHEVIRATRPRLSLVARLIHEALRVHRVSLPLESSPTDWTFAGDIGEALIALLKTPILPHALYHVTSGQTLTASEILAVLRGMLPEINIGVDFAPAAPFRGYMQPQRLLTETGFDRWTSFSDGLHQTVGWFKAQMEHSS